MSSPDMNQQGKSDGSKDVVKRKTVTASSSPAHTGDACDIGRMISLKWHHSKRIRNGYSKQNMFCYITTFNVFGLAERYMRIKPAVSFTCLLSLPHKRFFAQHTQSPSTTSLSTVPSPLPLMPFRTCKKNVASLFYLSNNTSCAVQ